MGFDVPDKSLHDVIYEESLDKMKQDPTTRKPALDIDRLMRTKFKDWAYEQEMRFFVELGPLKSESGKYFYPLSKEIELREVILGPRCEIGIDAIRQMVGSKIAVQKARLAVRSFGVVVDKIASRV